MSLVLLIIAGAQKGEKFLIKEGLTLGRNKADVALQDNRVSSLHALVEKDADGTLFLVDQGSTNGIKVDGQRVEELALVPGARFQIGSTLFEVRIRKKKPKPEMPAPPPEPESWADVLEEFIQAKLPAIKDQKRPLAAFDPAVRLSFLRGVQMDTVWTMGYGPRQVGPSSLDFPIYENGCPDLCFEILPSPEGTRFKTAHPEKVLINGKSVSTEVLKAGDLITVADAQIRIDFVND